DAQQCEQADIWIRQQRSDIGHVLFPSDERRESRWHLPHRLGFERGRDGLLHGIAGGTESTGRDNGQGDVGLKGGRGGRLRGSAGRKATYAWSTGGDSR